MNPIDYFNIIMVALRLDANKKIIMFDMLKKLIPIFTKNKRGHKKDIDNFAFKLAVQSNECKIIVKMVEDECEMLIKHNYDLIPKLGMDYYNLCNNIQQDMNDIINYCDAYIYEFVKCKKLP
jgi:hypothetical protein